MRPRGRRAFLNPFANVLPLHCMGTRYLREDFSADWMGRAATRNVCVLARVQAACVEHVPSRSSDLIATILRRCCRWRAAAVARRLPEICAAGRVVWVARAARRSASPPRASVVACAVHGLALASAREQRSTSIASWLEVALLRLSQLVEERWRATGASRVALRCNGIIYPICASATRFCSAYWQTASVRAPLHASDLAADI